MIIKNGITRKVFLIGKYAIKIPQTRYGWKLFLTGLLCNIQENDFSKMRNTKLCEILFSFPGGFLIVMKRANTLTEEQFYNLNIEDYHGLPVEYKICSFGEIDGKIVAVDYGS